MTIVAGADARPGAWVLVLLQEGRLLAMERHRTFAELLVAAADAQVIAVDVPLGHDDPEGDVRGGQRACDLAARDFLGDPSDRVELVPPFSVLDAPDRSAAMERADAAGLPRPSERLWALRARMQEARMAATSDDRLVECAPEVSFHALVREKGHGATLAATSASWRGLRDRLALLHEVGLRPTRSFGGIGLVTPQDVLDATIAAWTAARVAFGTALWFPAEGPVRLAA